MRFKFESWSPTRRLYDLTSRRSLDDHNLEVRLIPNIQMPNYVDTLKQSVRAAGRRVAKAARLRQAMRFPSYSPGIAALIERHDDDVRFASIALAISRLNRDGIPGALAELGVYRGVTSSFLRRLAPERRLYLFDTFSGFPEEALGADRVDGRFQDTSVEIVMRNIGDVHNVEFRSGYFPQSAAGLENETFAFVLLDFDLYESAMEGLRFFYPRLMRGAYFFLHDFNSPESQRAISRAASEFLADKSELLIEIPDIFGSAVFRKT